MKISDKMSVTEPKMMLLYVQYFVVPLMLSVCLLFCLFLGFAVI